MAERSDGGSHSGLDNTLDAAVDGAVSGDENAIRRLYRAIQPRLLRYLRAQVGEADAEDIAAETWSRIAHDLPAFRGNGTSFRAWAVTIARYRAIDHLRRRRPSTPLDPMDLPHQVARENTERDGLDAIATARTLAIIGALPRDQAQAILLRVVAGFDSPTAARILGKRPGAIRMASSRGLRKLTTTFGPGTDAATRDEWTATTGQRPPCPEESYRDAS